MDYSPPGSSVHGISQARISEWVTISFLWGTFLSQGLNPPAFPALAGFFTTAPPGKTIAPSLLGVMRDGPNLRLIRGYSSVLCEW